jgi:hypothetical protein
MTSTKADESEDKKLIAKKDEEILKLTEMLLNAKNAIEAKKSDN